MNNETKKLNFEEHDFSNLAKSEWSTIIQNYIFNESEYDELIKRVLASDLPIKEQLALVEEINSAKEKNRRKKMNFIFGMGVGAVVVKAIYQNPNLIKEIFLIPKSLKLK